MPLSPDPAPEAYYAAVAPRLCTSPEAAAHVVAALLEADVCQNDANGGMYDSMTPFHALEAPAIGVAAYVARLSQYAFSSTSCLIAAYYYVKRAASAEPSLVPTSLSVHRLLITALVLAAKYFDDVTYSMGYYAKVGGLPTKELAYLELRMLTMLRFELHISPADFHSLETELCAAVPYIPICPSQQVAAEALIKAEVRPSRTRFCEALHDSDPVGLWRAHPHPEKRMLRSLEQTSSPVNTPPASPDREAAPPGSCMAAMCRGCNRTRSRNGAASAVTAASRTLTFSSSSVSSASSAYSASSSSSSSNGSGRVSAPVSAASSFDAAAAGSAPLMKYLSTSTVSSGGGSPPQHVAQSPPPRDGGRGMLVKQYHYEDKEPYKQAEFEQIVNRVVHSS